MPVISGVEGLTEAAAGNSKGDMVGELVNTNSVPGKGDMRGDLVNTSAIAGNSRWAMVWGRKRATGFV
eukprot:5944902-Alexandrium_andersonii.AAC.1